jgi:hypothetical protein
MSRRGGQRADPAASHPRSKTNPLPTATNGAFEQSLTRETQVPYTNPKERKRPLSDSTPTFPTSSPDRGAG